MIRKSHARSSTGTAQRQWLYGFAVAVCAGCSSGGVLAADQGGSELTPIGATLAGGAEGAIPAWQPPGPQGEGWHYGELRADYWQYRDDKPVFTVTADNAEEYAGQLTPGHTEMLKQIPGYQMDVYPTRRSCGVPAFVAENTQKNVGFARLDATGLVLEDAYVPGVPFLAPENGAQAMWNMKMRYRGVGFDMSKNLGGISPRRGSDEWLKFATNQFAFWPWGQEGSALFSDFNRQEVYGHFSYLEPAALAGQSAIMSNKADADTETFYYFPGQRRVRRMPAYSYDAPQIGLDNQYNVDEISMFSGNLSRFDWKLLGKQELVVPYNAFGLYDFKAKFDDVALRDFIEPGHRRYELHRVWVVEATVRDGMRHSAPRRLFYLDEDSWAPLAAVDYDAQGRFAKVREGYLIPVYELGACDVQAFTQYNLIDHRYGIDNSSMGSGADHKWLTDADQVPRLKRSFYTPDNLRAINER